MGLDTKTYWLTDRQSQCDFDFDFEEISVFNGDKVENTGWFSSWEYKDKNGAWVHIRTEEYRVIEDEITRSLHSSLKW
jgi:hypothetical protein